jgi:transposase-like protein
MFYRRSKISEFIVDETQIKVGSELIWSGFAIEPESRQILTFCKYPRKETRLLLKDLLEV